MKCAVCGTRWDEPDPHHVVEQQELKRRGLHHLLKDRRNIMPLCPILTSSYTGRGEQCHERHTNASRRIPLSALTDSHRDFAFEVLGDYAADYLNRRYEKRGRMTSSPPPEDPVERPGIGSRWVWEIDKPHARELIEVVDVTWNGEEWWVHGKVLGTKNGEPMHAYDPPGVGQVLPNELDRFWEAATPLGSPDKLEGQRATILYDCAHNRARYAEPCDRCPGQRAVPLDEEERQAAYDAILWTHHKWARYGWTDASKSLEPLFAKFRPCSAGPCPVCGGRGWHTQGGNDPATCNCPAGEAWASSPDPEGGDRG